MATTDKTTADKTTADKTGTDKTPAETARQSEAAEPDQRLADEQTLNQTNSPDGAQADQATDQQADQQSDQQPDQQTDADDLTALSPRELIDRLTEANAENTRMKDSVLRARAEVENIRRRSRNEVVAAHKYAIEGFAQELLGVKDSLDRASTVELDESAGEAVRQMKEGLGLTLKQLDIAMAKFAVVEVEAAPGIRFDPERHQAISTAHSDEVGADHIVTVVQKGFLLKERLLRPAMVVVATKA